MSRSTRFFSFGLALTLGAGIWLARATSEAPEVVEKPSRLDKIEARFEKLPDDFARVAARGRNRLGNKISNAVFERLSEWDANVTLGSGTSLGVQAGRTVFANSDVEESFTVVDRMSFPVSLPGISLPLGVPGASFNFGISGRLDFTNLRVVKPTDSLAKETLISSLLDAEDLQKRRDEADASDWLKLALKQASEKGSEAGKDAVDLTQTGDKPVFFIDSLRNARYGRLWNQFSHPLRIPLKAEWLDRLDDSEVITYGGSGTVEVGPSYGLNYTFSGPITGASIGASFRAYLRGTYKISIMKLERTRARVKVTRGSSRGFSGSIGTSAAPEVYDGFLVGATIAGKERGKKFANLNETLVPFSFAASTSWGSSLDIGYEYDFTDARAVEAYEQAVIGRFGLSDELSVALAAMGEQAPVRRVFQRDSEDKSSSHQIAMRLNVFKRDASGSYSVSDAVVQFPDGTSHVFKARTDAAFSRGLKIWKLWKMSESVTYSVSTDYLEDVADPAGTGTFGWVAEGRIVDNSTSGLEMNRYSEMIESLFGKPGLFPRMPITLPLDPAEEERRAQAHEDYTQAPLEETEFGDSMYYFRVSLTPDQMMKFARIDDSQMWSQMEKGFERFDGAWNSAYARTIARIGGWFTNAVGWVFSADEIDQRLGARFIHADRFMDRRKELRGILGDAKSASQLTLDQRRAASKKVGEMYSDDVFVYELVRTTLSALREQGETDLSFHITTQSSAFPAIDIDGGKINDIDKITQRFARETDFDHPQLGQNLSLGITGLQLQVVSESRYEVKFAAAVEAPMVLIKIDSVSSLLKLTGSVKRLLIPNRGQFPAGANTLVLDSVMGEGFRKDLAQVLEPGKTYRMTIALVDGRTSGPAVSVEFKTKPAPKK